MSSESETAVNRAASAAGPSGASPRRLSARILVVSLFVAIGAATCSASPAPKPATESPSERPIRPETDSDRERFDRALETLESGNFAEARESFRLLSAEKSVDRSVSELSELYVARAMLGRLRPEGDDNSTTRRPPEKAVQMLASLQSDESVDARVRRAAQLYWAWIQVRHGARTRARSALSGFPGGELGSAILDRDRGELWPVLVDGLHENGQWQRLLDASAGYHDWLIDRSERRSSESSDRAGSSRASGAEERLERVEVDGDSGRDRRGPGPVEFARSRGFEAASQLTTEQLESRLESESSFVRATVGWAYLDRKLDADELTEEERGRIDDRYEEIVADLNAIGAAGRTSELSVKFATLGGDERLVIGALVPLSGPDASVGRRAVSGMLLAARAFRHDAPSRVTVVFEDSVGDPESTFRRLVDAGASAVVGPLDRSRARQFAPLSREHEVPLIALSAARPDPENRRSPPFVLRNFLNPIDEARAVAILAFREYGDRRAAVAFPDIGYGRRVREAFVETFRELGGRIVASVPYDRTLSDFSEPAGRIAEADPDAIFIPDSASNVSELAAFLADRDVWGRTPGGESPASSDRTYVHYLGTSLWRDPLLARQGSKYLRGAAIPTWFAEGFEDEATREFGRRFRGVQGRDPSDIEAFAYDNVRWLRSLMVERGLQQPVSIRDALLGGAEYHGATGTARFLPDGRLRRTVRFVTVGDGVFEPISTRVEATGERGDDDGESAPPSQPK